MNDIAVLTAARMALMVPSEHGYVDIGGGVLVNYLNEDITAQVAVQDIYDIMVAYRA